MRLCSKVFAVAQIPIVAGDRVEIAEHLDHPAVLGLEHRLHLRFGQPGVRATAQSACFFSTSSACALPARRYASSRPAMILWMV